MFFLTHQERKILLLIAVLILLGSILRFFNFRGIREEVSQPRQVTRAPQKTIPLNVNEASQKELERIPGIGPVTSQRIIEYRRRYGRFQNIEDLKKIKGIGDRKATNLQNYITFE